MRHLLGLLWLTALIVLDHGPWLGAQETQEPITGRVVAAASGQPVAGARVALIGAVRRGRPRAVLAETTTGADGRFLISEAPRERVRMISVQAAGFAFTIRPLDPQEKDLLLSLAPGLTLRGRVSDLMTDEPLAGATVAAGFVRTTTDAEGEFTLEGLAAETAEGALQVSAEGYVPAEIRLEAVLAEEPSPVVRVALEPGWVLRVRVQDEEGEPVAGARVRGRLLMVEAYSGLERSDFSALTEGDGVAMLTGLPPNQPVVPEVVVDGLIPSQGEVVVPCPRPAAGELPPVASEIVASAGRQAVVVVTDGLGRPLEGVELRLLPLVEPLLDFGGYVERDTSRGAIRQAVTDATGRVAFDLLPAGVLTCEVRAAGFETRMLVLHPTAGPAETLAVLLEPDLEPPAPDLPWRRGVEEAFSQAQAQGLPVFISMAMDGERANDWMAGHHLHDPEVVRAARELPCLLSNVFGPGGLASPEGVRHEEDGGVCTRYGTIPCASHQAVEGYCRAHMIDARTAFQVPRQIFVDPGGEVLMHRVFYLSERDLVWMVLRALRQVKPEVAVRLARSRLLPLSVTLAAPAEEDRRRAVVDLVCLVNSGDEHAVALLGDLVRSGVPARQRREILEGILLPALHAPGSALQPFLYDPDPELRGLAVKQLAGLADDPDVMMRLLPLFFDQARSVARAAGEALRLEKSAAAWVVAGVQEDERWRLLGQILDRRGPGVVRDSLSAFLENGPLAARSRVLRTLAAGSWPEARSLLLEQAALRGLGAVPALEALAAAVSRWGGSSGEEDVALVQMSAPESLVREAAVGLLVELGSATAREALHLALQDPADEVRIRAALSLWSLREAAALPVLIEALEHPLLGAEIQENLKDYYLSLVPETPFGWRLWLGGRGLLQREEGDG